VLLCDLANGAWHQVLTTTAGAFQFASGWLRR
jgi:hypothetical protein